MAIPIHVVYCTVKSVNRAGEVVNKDDPTTTLDKLKDCTNEVRIVRATDVPNSTNYPSVKEYLTLEAAADFRIGHMTQNMIVTYGS